MGRIIELDRKFYNELVAPMIHADFPDYENRIAVGVVGEGSDCFGYEDKISEDHDFGIGVCLWLTDADFASFGPELKEKYQALVNEWYRRGMGGLGPVSPYGLSERLDRRRGVQRIRSFYENIIGVRIDPADAEISKAAWFCTDEWKFAAAANGEVFRDNLGQFTGVRRLLLGYYPEQVWRARFANALHEFSGAMQSNYPRCMSRGDAVAANFCRTRSIDAAIDILFLLNRRFAPYYKWKYRALQELPATEDIAELLTAASMMQPCAGAWVELEYDARRVNMKDPLVNIFEQIAEKIAAQLYDAGLTNSKDIFLENHCQAVIGGICGQRAGRTQL